MPKDKGDHGSEKRWEVRGTSTHGPFKVGVSAENHKEAMAKAAPKSHMKVSSVVLRDLDKEGTRKKAIAAWDAHHAVHSPSVERGKTSLTKYNPSFDK